MQKKLCDGEIGHRLYKSLANTEANWRTREYYAWSWSKAISFAFGREE